MNTQIDIRTYSQNTQKFLFACAYRVVFADEKLVIEEQDWMIEAFGRPRFNGWLLEYAVLKNEEFFENFDILSGIIPFEEQQEVFPKLYDWLVECCFADRKLVRQEIKVVREIVDRIDLDVLLGRLPRKAWSYPCSYKGYALAMHWRNQSEEKDKSRN